MSFLICQVASIGENPDWIKAGLNYYGWNRLLILSTNDEKYIKLSNQLKSELEPLTKLDFKSKVDERSIKHIEILILDGRDILQFLMQIKDKLRLIRQKKYLIYYNATTGLQTWKFGMYFIYTEENLIDKFYYFYTDISGDEMIKPIEFQKPLKINESLKRLLKIFQNNQYSLDDLINIYEKKYNKKMTKGLFSRYLSELKELELIKESKEKKGRKKLFYLTNKGKWFI
ncbi:MAG: hypothetical protein ACTSRP_05135 [Candidatus Helarchaeota archaeon]